MESLIGDWVGKTVYVTTMGGLFTAKMHGKLVKVGESGILLELPKGLTFFPVAYIRHISLLNAS